jgi:hypothetical protein
MANKNGKRCKAHKTNGEPCNAFAVTGKEVCWTHGGATPRGLANPNTKHGRYSKDLPTRLAGRFEDALNDPQLGNLQSEIALLDTRLAEMIAGLDTEQYGDIWKQTADAFYKLRTAINSKDSNLMASALTALDIAIKRGYSDTSTWDSIVRVIEQRRKLTDSERKRQMDLQQVITTEQSMLLVSTLIRAVNVHVTDKRQLAAISNEIRTVIQ